jgi:hypothetical protein
MRELAEEGAMTAPLCTRCHNEPAVQGSELGVRCLWPEPAHEECARCGTVGPVDVPCAGCQPFPRDPRGLADAGAAIRPPTPCCRRIGASWCYLPDDGHPPAQCRAAPERELPASLLDRGRRG